MKFRNIIILIILVQTVCTAQQVTSIFHPTADFQNLEIEQIAIIPNRLPLVIQESEFWRRENWRTMARILESNGYNVLPYDVTIEAAKEAGLPLEDTFSSEDKFYNFCQSTNSDLVIMPYYGTGFHSSSFLIMINNFTFSSIVSYQFYSPDLNDFFHRADAVGENKYSTGILSLVGMGAALGGAFLTLEAPDAAQILKIGGGIASGLGLIIDTVRAAKPARDRWEEAFKIAVSSALDPFLSMDRGSGKKNTVPGSSNHSANSGGDYMSTNQEEDTYPKSGFEINGGLWMAYGSPRTGSAGGTFIFRVGNNFSMGIGLGMELVEGYSSGLEPVGVRFQLPLIFGDWKNGVAFSIDPNLHFNDYSEIPVWPTLGLYIKGFQFKVCPMFIAGYDDNIYIETGIAF